MLPQRAECQHTKPFATMLGELCENVLAHSEAVSPGYVCARVLEGQQRSVEIAICDSGIGFRGSFAKGTNETAKQRIAKGASPIEIALEGLNSSKPIPGRGSYLSYYGFGLYVVRRLVEENRGQMTIISGDELLALDRYGRKHHALSPHFPGTFVALVLDLDNPLPLEEIYAQAVESYIGPSVHSNADSSSTLVAVAPPQRGVDVPPLANKRADLPALGNGAEPSQPSERLDLMHFGTELLTREAGLAIRAELATRLLAGSPVTVNLDGLTDITPSVADEAFAKLAARIGVGEFERRVRFEGGTQLIKRLVDFVIRTRLR